MHIHPDRVLSQRHFGIVLAVQHMHREGAGFGDAAAFAACQLAQRRQTPPARDNLVFAFGRCPHRQILQQPVRLNGCTQFRQPGLALGPAHVVLAGCQFRQGNAGVGRDRGDGHDRSPSVAKRRLSS